MTTSHHGHAHTAHGHAPHHPHPKQHIELEARFLGVDIPELKAKLKELGAKDTGEDFLKEFIFFDKDLTWQENKKTLVRVRQSNQGVHLAYKHVEEDTIDGTEEIEFDFEVSDLEKVKLFLERIGLIPYCYQEKKRHSYTLAVGHSHVTVDIDTWPKIPTYVEIEADTEHLLEQAAKKLGLDWSKALFESPRNMIAREYNIHMENLRIFTFDRIEYKGDKQA